MNINLIHSVKLNLVVIIYITKATLIIKWMNARILLFQVNEYLLISDLLNLVLAAIITIISKMVSLVDIK